jgi:Protein of unknown function (DUF3828)
MRLWPALLALLATALAAGAVRAQAQGPADVIRAIYKIYETSQDAQPPAGVFSKRLQKLIDDDRKQTPADEVGRLDFDVFVNGQDWQLSELTITEASPPQGNHARVIAKFRNSGEPNEIAFEMVKEDSRWVIDDVASLLKPRWTMSKILTGAPDAFPDD